MTPSFLPQGLESENAKLRGDLHRAEEALDKALYERDLLQDRLNAVVDVTHSITEAYPDSNQNLAIKVRLAAQGNTTHF